MGKMKKISAVVVDDDSEMRKMLTLILSSGGYDVVGEAVDGEDAIIVCEKLNPGLILLDINMPRLSGLRALEGIRRKCPDAKVVMVSGEATMDKVSEAIKKGASGFIVKPLKTDNVLDKINTFLGVTK